VCFEHFRPAGQLLQSHADLWLNPRPKCARRRTGVSGPTSWTRPTGTARAPGQEADADEDGLLQGIVTATSASPADSLPRPPRSSAGRGRGPRRTRTGRPAGALNVPASGTWPYPRGGVHTGGRHV